MSDNIFPQLRGLTYPLTKTPNWSTITQSSMAGKKKFLQLFSYPFYKIKLGFNYLRDKQLQTDDVHLLMGFINKQGGASNDFLFYDATDHTAGDQTFGVGDGTTTKFQLCRNYGGFIEPIFGIVDAPVITVNDIPTMAYIWDTSGSVTFTTAPATSAKLAWSGTFYYRCHFLNDTAEFQNICSGLWNLEELELESLKP